MDDVDTSGEPNFAEGDAPRTPHPSRESLAFEHAPVALCMIDTEGRVVAANGAYVALLGEPGASFWPATDERHRVERTAFLTELHTRGRASGSALLADGRGGAVLVHLRGQIAGRSGELAGEARSEAPPSGGRLDSRGQDVASRRGQDVREAGLRPGPGEFVVTVEPIDQAQSSSPCEARLVDIAELHAAQAALEQQRAFVERVIDTLPNLVFVKDALGRFVLLNEATAKLLGAPKASLLRRMDSEVNDGADELALFQSLDAVVLRDRTTVVAEETFTTSDGERRFVTTKVPVEGEAGERLVLGTSIDVTESKRIEAELRAAKDAAESATRAKSEFVATMSHEIRTPLNGVIGATELLLASELSPRELGLIQVVRHSADALLAVVNDVLDFSRIEDGRLELESVPLSIPEIVGEVLDVVSKQAEVKGLELSSQVASELDRTVLGDPGRLRQILLNLASNAVKFTAAGEVVLRATLTSADDRFLRARFEVRDTGIGIAPDVVPRLFQSFTQADGSMSRRFGGSGLGLAISKRLAEFMGGTIGVFSTLGSGSTFWFVVPFGVADGSSRASAPAGWSQPLPRPASRPPRAARPKVAPEASLAGAEERASQRRREEELADAAARPRVLVAEDNPVSQMVVARMLELLGYAADVVPDGRQAVSAAFQGAYACVLMDCQMPELDGFEAARQIRAREALGRVPIVALTANALAGDRERCLDAGMDDSLSKPVELSRLRAALERWAPRRS